MKARKALKWLQFGAVGSARSQSTQSYNTRGELLQRMGDAAGESNENWNRSAVRHDSSHLPQGWLDPGLNLLIKLLAAAQPVGREKHQLRPRIQAWQKK